jgi:hypothetical protein
MRWILIWSPSGWAGSCFFRERRLAAAGGKGVDDQFWRRAAKGDDGHADDQGRHPKGFGDGRDALDKHLAPISSTASPEASRPKARKVDGNGRFLFSPLPWLQPHQVIR